MNLVFFTQEDPLYVRLCFEKFFQIYDQRDKVRAVVISRPMGKSSPLALARQMYGFYGAVDFLRMGARYVHAKVMDRCRKSLFGFPANTEKCYTIEAMACSRGVPVVKRDDLNSPEFIRFIKEFDADLFVSIASPFVFREELLSVPKYCCINIHNAPLPNYRGMMPNFWQLYHGEKRTGITIHKMVARLDAGEIIRKEFVPVKPGESLDKLIRRTKIHDALLLKEVLEDFRRKTVILTPMPDGGSYFTFPTKAEVREFRNRGGKLL